MNRQRRSSLGDRLPRSALRFDARPKSIVSHRRRPASNVERRSASSRNTPRDFCTSAGLGSMGFGFPVSRSARASPIPAGRCLRSVGDGGFQMTMPELVDREALPGAGEDRADRQPQPRHGAAVARAVLRRALLGNEPLRQSGLRHDRQRLRHRSRSASADPKMRRRCSRRSSPTAVPALLHVSCYPDELVWPMIPAGGVVEDLMESRT